MHRIQTPERAALMAQWCRTRGWDVTIVNQATVVSRRIVDGLIIGARIYAVVRRGRHLIMRITSEHIMEESELL